MMLTRTLGIIAAIILGVSAHAQDTLLVTNEQGKPVLFAMIRLTRLTLPEKTIVLQTGQQGETVIPGELFLDSLRIRTHIVTDNDGNGNVVLVRGENTSVSLKNAARDLDEVVVTGQLGALSALDATGKVRTIDRATIDAKGAVNLRDLLLNELNIRVSQDQVLGSGMSMLGMGGEAVKILIDGVPVIGRQNGNIDLSQINLSNIERIEIVEGPLSTNYGSNAMAGTINLITKKARKSGLDTNLGSYYETVGNYNLNAGGTYRYKKHAFTFNGARNFFDGWNPGDPILKFPVKQPADSGRFQQWKMKEQYVGGIKYTYKWKRTELMPSIDLFRELIVNRGYPRQPLATTAFDDEYKTNRQNAGLEIVSWFKNSMKLDVQLNYSNYKRIKTSYVKDLTTLNKTLLDNSEQDTSRFVLYFNRITLTHSRPERKFNYELGYDINYETGAGTRIEGRQKAIGDYAVFGSFDWAPKNWVHIKPGLRTTYNSLYKGAVMPALNLKIGKTHHVFRSSLATGFRSPSIKELYMEFVDINHNILGNPDLRPELSEHLQVWYTYSLKQKQWDVTAEISGYMQNMHNRISLSQSADGTLYSYFNIDRFYARGLQSSLKVEWGQWTLGTGFNYIGTASNYSGGKYAFSPALTGNLTYQLRSGNTRFSAFYKYTGKQVAYFLGDDASVTQSFMASYHLLDMQVQQWLFHKKLGVSIGGKNLLNVTNVVAGSGVTGGAHTSSSGTAPIAWGRSFYIQITYHFQTK